MQLHKRVRRIGVLNIIVLFEIKADELEQMYEG